MMNSDTLIIRRATPQDALALAHLAQETFVDTYAHANDANNMREHCEKYFGEAQQLAEIQDPTFAVLVAIKDLTLIGFAQVVLREPPACVTQEKPVGLYRFYVQKSWQGKGIAQSLFNAVVDAAKTFDGKHLWLTMWEHNTRALAFYEKVGFTQVGHADYPFGNEVQRDFVFVKKTLQNPRTN